MSSAPKSRTRVRIQAPCRPRCETTAAACLVTAEPRSLPRLFLSHRTAGKDAAHWEPWAPISSPHLFLPLSLFLSLPSSPSPAFPISSARAEMYFRSRPAGSSLYFLGTGTKEEVRGGARPAGRRRRQTAPESRPDPRAGGLLSPPREIEVPLLLSPSKSFLSLS